MKEKKPACLLDLDGTVSHGAPCASCLAIAGSSGASYISHTVLQKLKKLSQRVDIIIATARSIATVQQFMSAFHKGGIPIHGWILEHGAVVPGRPEWTEKILRKRETEKTRKSLERIIRKKNFPIDTHKYKDNHEGFLLFSGKGELLSEHLLDLGSVHLGTGYRTVVGRRKLALIPVEADKYFAFKNLFSSTHFAAFAAGDQPDDLTILQNASFPLAPKGAADIVKRYVRARQGFVPNEGGHEGTARLIDEIINRLEGNSLNNKAKPPLPLPREETELFRPSRRAYLDLLFSKRVSPVSKPDEDDLERLGITLKHGKDILIEVKMRDWGGEAKPLISLLKAFTRFLPYSRWRLAFRPERLGVENLTHFNKVTQRLKDFEILPGGGPRFSAPGVPGSPEFPGKTNLTLLLCDHPDDLAPFYDLVVTRLVTRCPGKKRVWFVNPMYLKINGVEDVAQNSLRKCKNIIFGGAKVMMAANIIGERDIALSVEGFCRLRDIFDRLIIAPRVVTNPARNKMIARALDKAGLKSEYFSHTKGSGSADVLLVDTYGDLPALYSGIKLTYLGGGFNPRKRGFDPMESLWAGAPVALGPMCDYNRITVDSLAQSGWIEVLKEPSAKDFEAFARKCEKTPPSPRALGGFIKERSLDPLRVGAEVMADLAGESENGYLFPENKIFPRDRINPGDLGI